MDTAAGMTGAPRVIGILRRPHTGSRALRCHRAHRRLRWRKEIHGTTGIIRTRAAAAEVSKRKELARTWPVRMHIVLRGGRQESAVDARNRGKTFHTQY